MWGMTHAHSRIIEVICYVILENCLIDKMDRSFILSIWKKQNSSSTRWECKPWRKIFFDLSTIEWQSDYFKSICCALCVSIHCITFHFDISTSLWVSCNDIDSQVCHSLRMILLHSPLAISLPLLHFAMNQFCQSQMEFFLCSEAPRSHEKSQTQYNKYINPYQSVRGLRKIELRAMGQHLNGSVVSHILFVKCFK